MTTSELYYFIGRCLVMDDDRESRRQVEAEISSGNVPWEEFVWMGSSHFVLPALYSAFRRNGIIHQLPNDLVEHLTGIYSLNLNRNLQIIEQSHELIRILNSIGIEPIFLKGAGHLLQNLYRDLGDRIMSDIDILIPAEDIQKATQLLYKNGYSHPAELKDDDFEEHHHLPGFENKNYPAMVELHHTVLPGKYQNLISNAEIFLAKKKIEGFNACVMSVNHQRLLNFVHDQLVDDDFKYKTMLIKGLYDFYLLANLGPPVEMKPLIKGYEKWFNTYCSFVSSTFNNTLNTKFTENLTTSRFRKQFDYLLNHPKIFSFYQIIILYSIRIPIILKSFMTAPFSKHSRHYIKKKVGTMSAVKRYFRNLRQEF
jgi:hypothetical protein